MNIFNTGKQRTALIGGLIALTLGVVLVFGLLFARGGKSEKKESRTKVEQKIPTKDSSLKSSSSETESAQSEEPRKELAEIKRKESEPKQEATSQKKIVVAWQPSHQDDTGEGWHEYQICGDIVDRTIAKATNVQNVKCWDVNHGLTGTNNYRPSPTNIVAFDYEIDQANQAGAGYFISVHNDGGAPSGVLGEYLPEDEAGKKLAEQLVAAVCLKTGLPNRGVRPVRLYSLESSRNHANNKCLLEIGDNLKDRDFLENPSNRELVAQAMADVVNGFGK